MGTEGIGEVDVSSMMAVTKVDTSDLFLLPCPEAALFALTMWHKKIQSLKCKNTKFEHSKRTYGLITSRLIALNLEESHIYGNLTTVSHLLRP